jgi:uncharacterized membrane protein
MRPAVHKHFTRRTVAPIRLLCYLLGPFAFMLLPLFRRYGHAFGVRFHAFHSMLMSGVWASVVGALRLVEHISPWFLSTVAKHTRFAMNLWFVLLWLFLLVTAYTGSRVVIIPSVHRLAMRLARKTAAAEASGAPA